MPFNMASTTDGDSGLAATMEMFGLEPDTATEAGEGNETQNPAPQDDPGGKTAADTESAETDTQETTEGEEQETESQQKARGNDGKFQSQVPKGVQKKIDKATSQQRTAERERDEAKARAEASESRFEKMQRELDELKSNITAAKPADPAPQAQEAPKFDKPKPKLADFLEDEDPTQAHLDATLDWRDEKAAFESDQKASKLRAEVKQEVAADQENREAKQAFAERVEYAKELLPDYDQVQGETTGSISAAMLDAIADYAEEGLDVFFLYYLAKNPDLAKRLTDASVYDSNKTKPGDVLKINRLMGREMRAIEADVRALAESQEAPPEKKPAGKGKSLGDAASEPPAPASKPQPQRSSRAPAPIEPVRGSVNAPPPDVSKMTGVEFREYLKTPSGKTWFLSEGGGTEQQWRMQTRIS